jgi:DNA-binding NarL/FixJ family response regulator
MIVLCSKDASLAKVCQRLGGGQDHIQSVQDLNALKGADLQPEDLLILDLQGILENELPELICPTLVLVDLPDFNQAMRLLRRGVRAYGNRHMLPENLKQAIAAVRVGQVWMPPAIVSRMIHTVVPVAETDSNSVSPLDQLSKREQEVAGLVAQGMSNKELADKLHISVRTVKAHLTAIFSKTGFRDRLELAIRLKEQ